MTDSPAVYVYSPVRRVLLTLVWGLSQVAASNLAGALYLKMAIYFGADASPYITYVATPLVAMLTGILLQSAFMYALGSTLGMGRSSIFPSATSVFPSVDCGGIRSLYAGLFLVLAAIFIHMELLLLADIKEHHGSVIIVLTIGLFGARWATPILSAIWARTGDPQPA